MRSDLVDVTVHVHHKTDKAVLVSDDGERDNAVWVPLSMCQLEPVKGQIFEMTLSQELAKEKGLV